MTYTKNREGYLIPSLSLPNQPNPYLNRYARLRLEYLEQNEPTLCDQLMLEGTLLTSCNRIGRAAQRMVDKTLRELMQTTQMPDRRTNPLGWTQMTNSLKKQAEEAKPFYLGGLHNGRSIYEAALGSWRTLWSPDQKMEP